MEVMVTKIARARDTPLCRLRCAMSWECRPVNILTDWSQGMLWRGDEGRADLLCIVRFLVNLPL